MNNGGGHSGGAAGGTTVAFTKGPPQMIYVGVYQKRPMVGVGPRDTHAFLSHPMDF